MLRKNGEGRTVSGGWWHGAPLAACAVGMTEQGFYRMRSLRYARMVL